MQDDLRELIAALQSNGVEFLVAGAHALAFYGHPRYTEDLDLFLRRSTENSERLKAALRGFGIPITDAAVSKLMNEDRQMIVLGVEPYAVDLMNFLDGIDFDGAWERRVSGVALGVPTFILSREHYVATKTASGRPKDLLDLEILNGN